MNCQYPCFIGLGYACYIYSSNQRIAKIENMLHEFTYKNLV